MKAYVYYTALLRRPNVSHLRVLQDLGFWKHAGVQVLLGAGSVRCFTFIVDRSSALVGPSLHEGVLASYS
jgi:hypothetical protein